MPVVETSGRAALSNADDKHHAKAQAAFPQHETFHVTTSILAEFLEAITDLLLHRLVRPLARREAQKTLSRLLEQGVFLIEDFPDPAPAPIHLQPASFSHADALGVLHAKRRGTPLLTFHRNQAKVHEATGTIAEHPARFNRTDRLAATRPTQGRSATRPDYGESRGVGRNGPYAAWTFLKECESLA